MTSSITVTLEPGSREPRTAWRTAGDGESAALGHKEPGDAKKDALGWGRPEEGSDKAVVLVRSSAGETTAPARGPLPGLPSRRGLASVAALQGAHRATGRPCRVLFQLQLPCL